MKKTFIVLFTVLLGINFTQANDVIQPKNDNSIEITLEKGADLSEYYLFEFPNVEELEKFDVEALRGLFAETEDERSMCRATVRVSYTFTLGGGIGIASSEQSITIEIEYEIEANCADIANAVVNSTRETIRRLREIHGH